MSTPTSYFAWAMPDYRTNPWFGAIGQFFDEVDSTVSVVHSLTSTVGFDTDVVSGVAYDAFAPVPLDGTFRVMSAGARGGMRGFFTVPQSGLQTVLDARVRFVTTFDFEVPHSQYAAMFLRAVVDGTPVTVASTWRHEKSSIGDSQLTCPLAVVSLGAGVHSVELQAAGRVSATGGYFTSGADSGYVYDLAYLHASAMWVKKPYHEVVMANSPLAYWRFGEPATFPLALDEVGSWHGIYFGTCSRVPAPGLLQSDGANGCVYTSGVDGTADCTEHLQANSLQMTGRVAYTVTGIIRPDSVGGSVRGYIIGTGSGASATTGAGWNVSLINGAFTYIRLDGAGSFQGGDITPTSLVTAHSNHWFALTFTGSIATAWLNGAPVGSRTGYSFSLGTTSNFNIGWRVGFIAAVGFRGCIDDVAVFSGVVPDDRLRAQYAASVVDG